MSGKRRDPLFGAAVLKLSFMLREGENEEGFRFVYEGVLRDLGVTEEEVDAYLEENRERVEVAARGKR
jgi:hypothetical protein